MALQCEIFSDILVDIGNLGGSSSEGVNVASTKKRKRIKYAKKSGPEESAESARNKSREETNNILRSLADRSEENISMKVTEISLHRNSLKELHSELRDTIQFISNMGNDNEYIDEIRNGLDMIRKQITTTQSDITGAEEELSTLKVQKVNRTRLQVLLSSDSDNTDRVNSDSSNTAVGIDDENNENDDRSIGEDSVDINGAIDPDAGEDDVDSY